MARLIARASLFVALATATLPIVSSAPARAQTSPSESSTFGGRLANGARVDFRSEQEAAIVVVRGNRERAAVRQACHDIHDVDYLLWIGGAAMIATGLVLAIDAFTTPAAQRDQWRMFDQGIGPGLVLGGIGFPFARGIVHDQDPVEHACERVEHPARGTEAEALDVELAAHLMHDLGPPASPIIIGFLTGATILATAGVITAFALYATEPTGPTNHYRDLVNLSGGVYAGVITGWFLIPPNPERRAATRFAHGYYDHLNTAPSSGPTLAVSVVPFANGGMGLGAGGTF